MNDTGSIRLIVGLGNPGADYAKTRHNAGFEAMEKVMLGFPGCGEMKRACSGMMSRAQFRGNSLYFLKPLTFMNLSGESVKQAKEQLGLDPSEILIMYDDLDLPVGSLRLRCNGSAGGHNGMTSVIQSLGTTQVPRLRIGIGQEGARRKQVDYVLSEMSEEERPPFEKSLEEAAALVKLVLARGLSEAMNRYNQKKTAEKTVSKEAVESSASAIES